MRAALLLVVLGALSARAAPRPMEGPVAVMPFKNLNQDPDTDWLSVGIAETMLSDLKKGGQLRVVERDQVDRALAQLALDGQLAVEPSTAAKLGKLVGAKTIVLGAFQKYGPTVRITARFVQVETGLVLDTAKVTGEMGHIFRLQDEIVAHLLGAPAPAQGRRRPSGARSVKAYRLYAMALTTSSSAQRVSYLQQAVKIDPDFSYALDDLKRLREEMGQLHQQSQKVFGTEEQQLRAQLGTSPDDPQAQQLFATELTARHFAQLVEDAHRIYAETAGNPARAMLHKTAAYDEFFAEAQLKRQDLALQLGTRFLAEFPGDPQTLGVESQMQGLVNEQELRLRGKDELAKADAELQKDEAELAKDQRAFEKRRQAALAEMDASRRKRLLDGLAGTERGLSLRRLNLDQQPCVDASRSHQFDLAIARCRAFLKRHSASESADAAQRVMAVRFYLLLALNEAGRFDEARKEIPPLLDDPNYGVSARMLQNAMPSSAPAP